MKHHTGKGVWEPHYGTKTLTWVIRGFFSLWLKEKFEPRSPSVREITSNERAWSGMAGSNQSLFKMKSFASCSLFFFFFQMQEKTENNMKQLTQLIFLFRHCPQFMFMCLYSRNIPTLIRFPQDILHMNVNHANLLESPGKSFPWRNCCAPEGTERMGTLSGSV